jgi:hypothetical protein
MTTTNNNSSQNEEIQNLIDSVSPSYLYNDKTYHNDEVLQQLYVRLNSVKWTQSCQTQRWQASGPRSPWTGSDSTMQSYHDNPFPEMDHTLVSRFNKCIRERQKVLYNM